MVEEVLEANFIKDGAKLDLMAFFEDSSEPSDSLIILRKILKKLVELESIKEYF